MVKCVGYYVQQDKSRSPEFAAPIHGTLYQSRVQLLFGETTGVGSGRFSYSLLRILQGGYRLAIFLVPTGESLILQVVDPSFLAGQDVHQLLPNGRMAESGNRLAKEFLRNGCDVAQQEIQPLVRCGV